MDNNFVEALLQKEYREITDEGFCPTLCRQSNREEAPTSKRGGPVLKQNHLEYLTS